MRVAYICADPGVPVSGCKGCSVHVKEFLNALLDLGLEAHLFATNVTDVPSELQKVRVYKLPAVPKGDLSEREESALKLNGLLPDILKAAGPFDLYYERYSLWSFAGMEFARSTDRPALLEVNAPLIEEQTEHRGLINRKAAFDVANHVFQAATAVIAVSREIAEYVLNFIDAPDRIHVIPNAVNPARFAAAGSRSIPATPGIFTIGFLGMLKPWHDLSSLAEAFGMLYRRDQNIRLLVIGDGPQKEAFKENLLKRGVLDAVDFTGAVDPERVPGLLASVDVAVAPYAENIRHYFSPLKLFEYMAASLPLVAAGIGQINEVIQDECNGLLYPPGDAIALAKNILRLKEHPRLRESLGRNARASVLLEHTWSNVVQSVLDIAGLRTHQMIRTMGANI